MKTRVYGALLVFFLLINIPAFSQEAEGEEEQSDERDFFLVPVLEIVFSGSLRWNPNWPADMPPDGFSLPSGNPPPVALELSNGNDTFVLRRDSEGRLLEFPFFYDGGYAKIKLEYSMSGSLQTMNISFNKFRVPDEESQQDESQDDEETWYVALPPDFLPYSELSPGGSFPVISVSTTLLNSTASPDSSSDSDFFVFIFESPLFLTETWYDSDGNMLSFCKASVNIEKNNVEKDAWRIRSLQNHGESGVRIEDRFFDSFGNITELRFYSDDSEDRRILALYRENKPLYWQRDDFIYDLQWDTREILTVIKAWDKTGGFDTEYRYRYDMDDFGIWIRREEVAYKFQYDLLVPQPQSRGIWTRRFEDFQTEDFQFPDNKGILNILRN